MFLKGVNGSIELCKDHVIIKKGILFGNSIRTVYLTDVIGVQYKKSGITRGHIEIITSGDKNDKKSIVDQPTIVLLKMGQDKEALEIKRQIDDVVMQVKKSKDIKHLVSEADELLKFKSMLDKGVITEEEYNNKKKQILDL